MSKVLVVGAGISGLTAARILKDAGHSILILEKSHCLGGACSDYFHDGYFIGMHGTHIFHTNSDKVWNFLSRFTEWLPFRHRVCAMTDRGVIPVPFNDISEEIVGEIDDVGIIELLFRNYSRKMWGVEWDSLPDFIRSRVPTRRIGTDCRYFSSKYEGVPSAGYSSMFARMAEGIEVVLGVGRNEWKEWGGEFDRVIYSGNVDEIFDHSLGALKFRSLKFHMEWGSHLAGDAHVLNNCTISGPIRTVDYAKMYGVKRDIVPLIKEYPCDSQGTEPYYPMWDMDMYDRYEEMATSRGIELIGRLAQYKYMDMDVAVGKAMEI